MSKFIENEAVEEISRDLLRKDRNATVWDLVVSILAKNGDAKPYVLWILSDLPIIEPIARGYDIKTVVESSNLPLQEVLSTSKVWGMEFQEQTLDFDPVEVYNDDMTLEVFRGRVDQLAILPSEKEMRKAYLNAQKYYSIRKLLDEWEDGHE